MALTSAWMRVMFTLPESSTVPFSRTPARKLLSKLPKYGKGFAGIGANGFYLQQTTADSGGGARLGTFEEMTAGVGPVLSYAGQIGKHAFAAEVKWLPQLGTQNTLKGDYVWFKVGVQF